MRHAPDPGRRAVGLLAGARLVSVAGPQAAQVALIYTIYQGTGSSAWVSAALRWWPSRVFWVQSRDGSATGSTDVA
jgi:hypothetical protein